MGFRKQLVLCAATALFAALVSGCTGPLLGPVSGSDTRVRHRELAYEIDDPSRVAPEDWLRIEVAGADLAFRRRGEAIPQASTMSMQSDCRRTLADASMLARHLRIGLPSPVLLQGGPVLVDGRSGWSQVFDTSGRDGRVRVKTITAVVGDCTFDWILVARGDFDGLEPSFDRWWESFRRASTATAVRTS